MKRRDFFLKASAVGLASAAGLPAAAQTDFDPIKRLGRVFADIAMSTAPLADLVDAARFYLYLAAISRDLDKLLSVKQKLLFAVSNAACSTPDAVVGEAVTSTSELSNVLFTLSADTDKMARAIAPDRLQSETRAAARGIRDVAGMKGGWSRDIPAYCRANSTEKEQVRREISESMRAVEEAQKQMDILLDKVRTLF